MKTIVAVIIACLFATPAIAGSQVINGKKYNFTAGPIDQRIVTDGDKNLEKQERD